MLFIPISEWFMKTKIIGPNSQRFLKIYELVLILRVANIGLFAFLNQVILSNDQIMQLLALVFDTLIRMISYLMLFKFLFKMKIVQIEMCPNNTGPGQIIEKIASV